MAQQKNPDIVDKNALRLDVTVKSGRNLKLRWWQRMIDPFHMRVDAFVSLETSRHAFGYEAFSSERTTTILADDNGNVEWAQGFSFVVPDGSESETGSGGHSGRGILTLAVYDRHTILGDKDFSGKFEVNIDKLTVTKEKTFQKQIFHFGNNGSLSTEICLRKLTEETIDMRLRKDLNPQEVEVVAKRKKICRNAISKLLGKDILPDKVPVVSIVASGGGFRTMTAITGSVQGLKETGLLDCATYFASLSGSTWYLSNLFYPELYSKDRKPDVDQCAGYLKECCSQMGPDLFLKNISGYVDQLIKRRDNGLKVSLVDLWGCYLTSVFKMAIDGQPNAKKVSQQRSHVETANFPFPIYTAVHVRSKVEEKSFCEWMEFTPYEYGFSVYGSFMDVKDLPGRACKGVVCQQREELDVGYMMGLWGSAFGVTLHRVLHNLIADSKHLQKVLVELMSDYLKAVNIDELRPFAAALPNMLRGVARDILWKWLHSIQKAFRALYASFDKEIEQLEADLFSPSSSEPPVTPKPDKKLEDEESMIIIDAGSDFNDPIPPVIRPNRRSDVLIVFDNSALENQWVDPFEQLDLAYKWAEAHSVDGDIYKFPKIDHSKFDKNNIKECYVFEDEDDSECPIVVFFPLCNPKLKKDPDGNKPAPGQNEVNPFAAEYGTFDLSAYDAKKFDGLKDLCYSNLRSGFEKIKEAIAKKANR